MDLKTLAKQKLKLTAIREDSRLQWIGGSAVGLLVVVLALLLAFTTWSGDGSAAEDKAPASAVGPEETSDAVVEISPRDGKEKVATSGAVEVGVAHGRLKKVTVKDAEGKAVEGTFSQQRTVWKPVSHLATGTKYTVDALATDADGKQAAKHASFTTVVPKDTFIGYFTPEDGDKVGAGMPVSINFNRSIADREAVEKAITVTADPEVDIAGHWFGDRRLDFRPKEYWASGTDVTLTLDLNGVRADDGVYGTQDKTVRFTVDRQQVSVVDAKKKEMVVKKDGKKIKTIPITAGSDQNPTYNGKMVISEKHKVTRMNGDTVGFGGEYDIKDVPHAMRLSTSGTFIHGNYWTPQGQFGQVNTSHGCVGLFDKRGGNSQETPGAWFYDHSKVGDIVEVKNSNDETIDPDNGLNGWNMSWHQWKADE